MNDLDELEMHISASRQGLSHCRRRVARAAARLGFKDEELMGIVSAVSEACINALTHGCPNGKSAPVLYLHTHPNRFEAVVQDSGQGFTCPANTPMPSISSRRGRGIPLMKHFMDEIKIESRNGCRVTLVKYVHPRRRAGNRF